MDAIKDFLKKGAVFINDTTSGLKPYSTILYVLILIIIVAIFISFFTKSVSAKLLNAYTAFTIIFAVWSFFSISIDLLVDSGQINYGYIVAFVINAVLGMTILHTLGYMKIFETLVAFFLFTLVFIVWLTDTNKSDVATDNTATSIKEGAVKIDGQFENSFSSFLNFCKFDSTTDWADFSKIKDIVNFGWLNLDGWGKLLSGALWVIWLIFCIILIPVMLVIWGFTGLFQLMNMLFGKISSDAPPISTSSNSKTNDMIHWIGILLLFMMVILILFSSQSAMRKNPIATLGIGIVAAIACLGYVRFFKSESFTSTFTVMLGALFVLYLYLYNPYNIFHKMSGINLFAIFLIFFGILGMIFMIYKDKDVATTTPTVGAKPVNNLKNMFADNYKNLLKGFIGLVVSIGFIMFLVASIGSMQSSDNNPTAGIYILNTLIVIGMLTIVFNVLDAKYKIRDNNGFKLFLSILLYVPCLLSDLADVVMSEYYKTKYFTLIIIVLEIIFAICYWVLYSKVVSKIYTGGGKVLVNSPVPLNKEQTVGYYRSLSGGPVMDYTLSGKPMLNREGNPLQDASGNLVYPTRVNTYKFGISCWLYLNPMPSHGAAPLTILDYGSNPTVSYSPQNNELTVNVMDSDCSTTIAVYSNKNPPIQKWFNLILNYDGGHLDIFLDSVLVKTSTNVISCVSYDALKIGQKDGLDAKLCNLIYFKTPLDIITIHNMYNITKIEDIPDIPKRDLFSI